jgi:hypothetical protein
MLLNPDQANMLTNATGAIPSPTLRNPMETGAGFPGPPGPAR